MCAKITRILQKPICSGTIGLHYYPDEFLSTTEVADALLEWGENRCLVVEADSVKEEDGETVALFKVDLFTDITYIMTLHGNVISVLRYSPETKEDK